MTARLSLTFVALTLGLAFAHVLEIVGKLRLDGPHWLIVQHNLYVAFGPIGGTCELLAVVLTWLAIRHWRAQTTSSRLAWVAAVAASVGLLVWATVVAPMNTVLNSWTPESLPADWTGVRNRWEIGHAVQALLFAVAFLAVSNTRPTDAR